MIKFSLVDVRAIQSNVPRSNFSEEQIEQLADMILECEGVLNVISLSQTGINNYIVLAGDLEYYAAVRAKEKNPRQGEMINAVIVQPSNQDTLLKQADFLKNCASSVEQTGVTPLEETSLEVQLTQQLRELMKDINTKFQALSQTISSENAQMNHRLQQLENTVKLLTDNLDRLTQLVEQIIIIPPPPPPPPSANKLNLRNAGDPEIEEELKKVGVNDKQIEAAVKAIDHWKKVEGGLTWNNLKKSTKPGRDKIKNFGDSTYEKLKQIGEISNT
jgi:hypothetical protein